MKSRAEQCRYLLAMTEPFIAALNDDHRALLPRPGAKTAGWLLGHLAVSGDFARHLCGASALCPPEWGRAFSPGTQPSIDPAQYPSMDTLRDTVRAVYLDLDDRASKVDPALLAAANPSEAMRAEFPTIGEFVTFLASGHLAYHLGQLVAWCAAANVARVGAPAASGRREPARATA